MAMRLIAVILLLPGLLMARAVGGGHAHCGHAHAGHEQRPHWHWHSAPCTPGESHQHSDSDHDSDAVYVSDDAATVAPSTTKQLVDSAFDVVLIVDQWTPEFVLSKSIGAEFWPPGIGSAGPPLFIQHLALMI